MNVHELGNDSKKRFTSWKNFGATLALAGALLSTTPQEAKSQSIEGLDSLRIENINQGSDSLKDASKTIKELDPTKIQMYSGIGIDRNQGVYSATRLQAGGSFFKDEKLQVNVFGFLDVDGNPLKFDSKGFGRLYLDKKIYKGFTAEATYIFNGGENNIAKFGLGFGGVTKEGFYKIRVYPLSNKGEKEFEVLISGGNVVGKNGYVSSFIDIQGLDKSFYGETEFAYDFGKHIAGFVQARYGGPIKDPFIAGVAGIRLNVQ